MPTAGQTVTGKVDYSSGAYCLVTYNMVASQYSCQVTNCGPYYVYQLNWPTGSPGMAVHCSGLSASYFVTFIAIFRVMAIKIVAIIFIIINSHAKCVARPVVLAKCGE